MYLHKNCTKHIQETTDTGSIKIRYSLWWRKCNMTRL